MSTTSAPASLSQAIALVPRREDFVVGAVHPVFLGDTDLLAREVRVQRRRPFGHRQVEAGRILGIEAGHRLEHDRAILDVARHRAGLVERAGEGDDAPAAAAAVSRLDPRDAGQRGRLADRAAGVGAGRRRARAARTPPRSSRPTSRPARGRRYRRPACRHGLTTLPKWLVSFDEPIANWSMLSLPSMPAPASHSFWRDGAFVLGHEAFEDVAAPRWSARRGWRTGPSSRSARRPSCRAACRRRGRHRPCRAASSAFSGVATMKALSAARGGDVGVERLGHFARGEIARGDPVADRLDAEFGELGHYSITLGTP